MTEYEIMLTGGYYIAADEDLTKKHQRAVRLCRKFNKTNNLEKRSKMMKKLFGKIGEGAYIEPSFFCDYGCNIHIGKDFYANFNCIMLDVNTITIGDRVFLAPDVKIFSATHPIDPVIRGEKYEYGLPITIGNDVWIGGGSIINPGVRIGNNVVIGSGSVVTKDIPDNSIAAGNPAKVLRKITEDDIKKAQELKARYHEIKGA